MKINKMRQSDEGFWGLMGPFFASAQVRQLMGVTMNSDESYKWFIAIESGVVIGFCATTPDKGHCFRVRYAHVVSGNLQVKTKLLIAAAQDGVSVKKSMVGKDFISWENAGFTYTGKEKGHYKEMGFKVAL